MRLPSASRLSRATTGSRESDSALMSGGRLDEDWPASDTVKRMKAAVFRAMCMRDMLVEPRSSPRQISGQDHLQSGRSIGGGHMKRAIEVLCVVLLASVARAADVPGDWEFSTKVFDEV